MIRELFEDVVKGFAYAFGAFAALEVFLVAHADHINQALEVIGFR